MLENIEVLNHSCIKFNYKKTIYVDPFNVEKNYNDADIIIITHNHYDHYSEEDIEKVKKENSIIIVPEDLSAKVLKYGLAEENIVKVKPNNSYNVEDIKIETIPAYNINKKFHPKENNWVGYILEIKNVRYYIAGDTDITEENKKIKCDIAFVPVGGTYTMNHKEAAELVNEIKPQIAVPIHYGSIVGDSEDARRFVEALDNDINGIILMKKK